MLDLSFELKITLSSPLVIELIKLVVLFTAWLKERKWLVKSEQ